MTCRNCGSSNIELTHEGNDGQGYEYSYEYTCQDCDCVWEEATVITIIEYGKMKEEV